MRSITSTHFAERFRRLRLALGSKQSSLSASGLRCTDTAVSHWERGKRLPTRPMMTRIAATFLELGVKAADVEELQNAWAMDKTARRSVADQGVGSSSDRKT